MVPAAELSRRSIPSAGTVLLSAASGLAALVLLIAGCSPHSGPREVSFSPSEVAQRAMAQYDKNRDGVLDAAELEQCPALKDLAKELDKAKSSGHKPGCLTTAEIENCLDAFQKRHAAMLGVTCKVQLDGNPLPEATVTFVPEEFMGPSFKSGSGTTDAEGFVHVQTEGQEFPGVAPGFYRIQVSKKDAAGHELLPPRYNTQTILGRQVTPFSRGGGAVKLSLTSS